MMEDSGNITVREKTEKTNLKRRRQGRQYIRKKTKNKLKKEENITGRKKQRRQQKPREDKEDKT